MIVTPTAAAVPGSGSNPQMSPVPTPLNSRETRRIPPTNPMPSQPSAAPAAPHIDLGGDSPANLEWLKWVMLALVAVLSALVALLLFPKR